MGRYGSFEQAFRIAGLNWILERSFVWLGRHRRMSKDYEYRVQTAEAFITIAACAQMIRGLRRNDFSHSL
nr:transposase [uncultured Jannaschia sp.]